MKNSKIFILLLAIAGCAHSPYNRTPSSASINGPVVNYETTIKIPRSTEEKINYVLVRGRFEYKLDKEYSRHSKREFIPQDHKDIKDRLYVNEQDGYWKSTVTPRGIVVPKVQIQKSEGLICFMTMRGSLLNDKVDHTKFNFDDAIQLGMAYRLFDSDDKQSLIAPYDEIKGLDAVVCTYLGEKDSIDIQVKYSFLSPEVSRFADRYKNEILDIYAPYTSKESITSRGIYKKGVESDLPSSDRFSLGDSRFEDVEKLYKRWESQNFVLSPEIKEALGSTLGVYGRDQKIIIAEKSDAQLKQLGHINQGSLVRILPGGGLAIKKGFSWYNAQLTGHEEVKGLKKFFLGKKSRFSRADVKPLSFYCTIGKQVVFKAESWNNDLEFNAPLSGKLACGINMHQKTKEVSGSVNVSLIVYDPQDAKIILESFMDDEKNFVQSYSNDISEARLESIKSWTDKLNR